MLKVRADSPKARATTIPPPLPNSATESPLTVVRERIRALVEAAVSNGSTISLNELFELLPARQFSTASDLRRFLATDEGLSTQVRAIGQEVATPGREDLAGSRSAQRELARTRLVEANRFLELLASVCPWIELAGVSGSTAYGSAKPSDDIDFFVVTTRRRLWASLLLTLAIARWSRVRNRSSPAYCFNRVLERKECERVFREEREPLFAREALNLAVLSGDDLYRQMLASAPWMREPFPKLYATRLAGARDDESRILRRSHLGGDVLNLVAFLGLAPYLWGASLVRNRSLNLAGRNKECFRTLVRRDCYATESEIYEDLRAAYRQAFT